MSAAIFRRVRKYWDFWHVQDKFGFSDPYCSQTIGHRENLWVPNERCGYYLSNDALWFAVGQVVQLPQPLKVKQFFKMFKNAENGYI